MAFGRIKRSADKVSRSEQRESYKVRGRNVRAMVRVYRMAGSYEAYACLGSSMKSRRTAHPTCSRFMTGRTPQSAVAKALKHLAITVARRGTKSEFAGRK